MGFLRLAIADVHFLVEKALAFAAKQLLLPFISMPSTTPDRFTKIEVQRDVPVPMRDGVKLFADVYKPRVEGSFPVILVRLPYGKQEYYCTMPAYGRFWARKGYVFVVQDVRGKWRSEGKFEPLIREGEDGYDTLTWIAEQPWCDGNIGMMGESYYGYTQWAVAVWNHPNLKCIAPMDISPDRYALSYQNGALCFQTLAGWAAQQDVRTYRNVHRLNFWHLPVIDLAEEAGLSSDFYKELISHPTRDTYWDQSSLHDKYDQVRIPALHVGGWYDVFLDGTIEGWKGVRDLSSDHETRENQWLLIAPIDHEHTSDSTSKIGRLSIKGENWHAAWMFDRHQEFFDFWLKGMDNDWGERPRVEIFVMGDNRWRFEDEWPLARTVYTKFYFHSRGAANTDLEDGRLDRHEPGEEPSDGYVYDPTDPVTISLETDIWMMAKYLKDRRSIETRADVLVYTSQVLVKDMEITGPITVTLYAASSAWDTDFTATLVDVFPDGHCHLIQEGIIRASYRESDREPSPIEPGKVYQYLIDLWATSYVIRSGHRIRMEISSSNFNRFDRNLNTGNQYGMDSEVITATQTVNHSKGYPSHITLPIIMR